MVERRNEDGKIPVINKKSPKEDLPFRIKIVIKNQKSSKSKKRIVPDQISRYLSLEERKENKTFSDDN